MPRERDARLLTGRGRFRGAALPPGNLHAAFIRSPLPHGVVRGIASTAVAGDVALFATGTDLDADDTGPIAADTVKGFLGKQHPDWAQSFQTVPARGRVRQGARRSRWWSPTKLADVVISVGEYAPDAGGTGCPPIWCGGRGRPQLAGLRPRPCRSA